MAWSQTFPGREGAVRRESCASSTTPFHNKAPKLGRKLEVTRLFW